MTPHKYSLKDETTIFHYHFSELREFIKLGKLHGDCGMILMKRRGNMFFYRGFGTVGNSCRNMVTWVQIHNPIFGNMATDDERLIPPKPLFTKENTKIVILDTSKL